MCCPIKNYESYRAKLSRCLRCDHQEYPDIVKVKYTRNADLPWQAKLDKLEEMDKNMEEGIESVCKRAGFEDEEDKVDDPVLGRVDAKIVGEHDSDIHNSEYDGNNEERERYCQNFEDSFNNQKEVNMSKYDEMLMVFIKRSIPAGFAKMLAEAPYPVFTISVLAHNGTIPYISNLEKSTRLRKENRDDSALTQDEMAIKSAHRRVYMGWIKDFLATLNNEQKRAFAEEIIASPRGSYGAEIVYWLANDTYLKDDVFVKVKAERCAKLKMEKPEDFKTVSKEDFIISPEDNAWLANKGNSMLDKAKAKAEAEAMTDNEVLEFNKAYHVK